MLFGVDIRNVWVNSMPASVNIGPVGNDGPVALFGVRPARFDPFRVTLADIRA